MRASELGAVTLDAHGTLVRPALGELEVDRRDAAAAGVRFAPAPLTTAVTASR